MSRSLCAIVVAGCFDVYPHKSAVRFAAAGALRAGGAVRPGVLRVAAGRRVRAVRRAVLARAAVLDHAAGKAALRTHGRSARPRGPCCARLPASWRGAMKRAGEGARALTAPCATSSKEASLSFLRTRTASSWPRRTMRCAWPTLSERSRIAREITTTWVICSTRSVLQVEALQVVHADDESAFRGGLASVGATLHEAMDTVRKAVRPDDDAFDLRARWKASSAPAAWTTAASCTTSRDKAACPSPTAWWAVVREALSNVAKHSDATRVDVSVIRIPGSLPAHRADTRFARAAGARSTAVDVPTAQAGIGLQTMEEVGPLSLGGRAPATAKVSAVRHRAERTVEGEIMIRTLIVDDDPFVLADVAADHPRSAGTTWRCARSALYGARRSSRSSANARRVALADIQMLAPMASARLNASRARTSARAHRVPLTTFSDDEYRARPAPGGRRATLIKGRKWPPSRQQPRTVTTGQSVLGGEVLDRMDALMRSRDPHARRTRWRRDAQRPSPSANLPSWSWWLRVLDNKEIDRRQAVPLARARCATTSAPSSRSSI